MRNMFWDLEVISLEVLDVIPVGRRAEKMPHFLDGASHHVNDRQLIHQWL